MSTALGIDHIDHFVLDCRDVEEKAAWHRRVLGMRRETFGEERIARSSGGQKINLRSAGAANWITGAVDAPGSADFRLITTSAPEATLAHHPDGNLVEIAHCPADPA